ncbi:ATP-binding response regulator [Schlesneria paludicola]|uniref:ATP-binding response regulator n=1 Tax=Schlesneria paludicola TaxID=360056 RepID=UPI00029ABA78|nr:response regulator [Schlesneria paludicola]
MPTILIVDDSATDRRLAGGLVGSIGDATVEYAIDGGDALIKMELHVPDVVITDLDMPSINGLELVNVIRKAYPVTPVILMTAQGSEEIAVKALKAGASSYVPKRQLHHHLSQTVQQVLQAARVDRAHLRLMRRLIRQELEFVLENDEELLMSLVQYLQDTSYAMGIVDESDRVRIGVALQEALTNASFHGNLELSSSLREGDHRTYYDLAAQRARLPPWSNRRIHVIARFTAEQVEFTIRDEGPGFDPTCLPDPTDSANLERPCGRGLLLIHNFMDEVRHNELGNEVTLVKRRKETSDLTLVDEPFPGGLPDSSPN